MRTDKVNILFILFNEKDLQLVREACVGLKHQSSPCFVTVVYDVQTNVTEKQLVDGFQFDEYITAPVEFSTNPALKHKWAYDRSPFQYVAFQQCDDQPYLARIEVQLSAMQTSKKRIGISFGGFHYCINKNLDTMRRDNFRFIEEHLFNVGYPSFWLCDKTYLPILPEIQGFEKGQEWEWDLFMLIEMLKQVESIVIEESVGIYNQHMNNSTNTHITEDAKKNGLQHLKDYFKTQRLSLKNIYFIGINGERSDNK